MPENDPDRFVQDVTQLQKLLTAADLLARSIEAELAPFERHAQAITKARVALAEINTALALVKDGL